jgi:hypothetical protein
MTMRIQLSSVVSGIYCFWDYPMSSLNVYSKDCTDLAGSRVSHKQYVLFQIFI